MVHTTDGWFARRVGMAADVSATTPNTLVSNIRRQSSMLACSTGQVVGVDARVVHEHAQIGGQVERRGVGDVEPADLEPALGLRCHGGPRIGVPHGGHRVEAAAGQFESDGPTDPATRPGHQCASVRVHPPILHHLSSGPKDGAAPIVTATGLAFSRSWLPPPLSVLRQTCRLIRIRESTSPSEVERGGVRLS